MATADAIVGSNGFTKNKDTIRFAMIESLPSLSMSFWP